MLADWNGKGGEGAIVGLLVGRQFEAYCSLSSACSTSSLVDLGSSPGCLLVAGLGTTAPYCCWLAGVAPGSVRVLVVNIGCQNRLLAIHASLLLSPPELSRAHQLSSWAPCQTLVAPRPDQEIHPFGTWKRAESPTKWRIMVVKITTEMNIDWWQVETV